MRAMLVAFVCLTGSLLLAPDCRAAQMETKSQSGEPARAGAGANDCRRHGPRNIFGFGRCSVREHTAAYDADANRCAPIYGYRGHRRVDLRARVCRPLFSRNVA